jgi:hypothetical protein
MTALTDHSHSTPSDPPGSPGSAAPTSGQQAPTPAPPGGRPPRLPSVRASAALAASMLAIGVGVGAAIGPAPSASFAGINLPTLLSTLAAQSAPTASTSTTAPPPISPTATPTEAATASTEPAQASETGDTGSKEQTQKETNKPAAKGANLPPVTRVWLIELSGTSFTEAKQQASVAPFITGTAIPAGSLLNGWSAIQAGAFASDAALIAAKPPQLLDTIVQPACPEGEAGLGCQPGTSGALKTADEFLAQTLPTITSNALYKSNGLIVVTFSSVLVASATGLPAGASTSTLTSEPPAGALLISPFVTAGASPATKFDPSSPVRSLSKLLHE